MKSEVWKAIPGYEGIYEVSSYGRVKRLARTILVKRNGGYRRHIPEKIMKQTDDGEGYLIVGLTKNYKQTTYRVARLVAKIFIGNPHNKPEVNHKDGIKYNNHYLNLEWVTRSENQKHACDTGLQKTSKGRNHYLAKIDENDVVCIWERINNGHTDIQIALDYDISRSSVYQIRVGRAWKHVQL